MSDDLERVKQDIEKERIRQRIVNAYHRTFETPEGKLVLKDLNRYFKTDQPAFIAMNFAIQDAAFRDGQRSVILRINKQLSVPVKADGDIDKPKTKIKK